MRRYRFPRQLHFVLLKVVTEHRLKVIYGATEGFKKEVNRRTKEASRTETEAHLLLL